jgi:hypothetical protein
MHELRRIAGLFASVVAACGTSSETETSSGNAFDASQTLDAAAEDALATVPLDAAPTADAGRDARTLDANVGQDGESPDALPRDSSTSDASTADAIAPRDSAALSARCQGAASAAFEPPTTCDAQSGNTTTSKPSNAIYSTSWFGCYRNAAGTLIKDPTDNCEFACGNRGLCAAGLSGPECQAQLKWFAADADRFGCGTRIKVTNCANGRAVVLTTLDRGPNCRSVEQAYGAPVLDMSWPAMTYLFEGRTFGGNDKRRVVAEVVPAATPLGPSE